MAAEPSRSSAIARPARPEDAPSLHKLLLAGLSDVPADLDRWLARCNWQYHDNPFRQDRPAGWVMVDGDCVVGHLGAVYVPVVAGAHRATGVIGADYVVSEERLKVGGVFAGLQLAQAFFDGIAECLHMATTANDKTGAVFGRFGCKPVDWTREFWRAPATLRQEIRTCRGGANRVIRRLTTGPLGFVGSGLLGATYALCGHRPALPIPPGCRLDIGTSDLALEAAALWESMLTASANANGHARIAWAIDRTREYLEWRYLRHPESADIRTLLVRTRGGQVIGAAVVFIQDQDRPRRKAAFLEEWLAAPDRPDVMHTLIAAALKLACDHEAEHLICTAGHPGLRGRLWEYGFEPRARSAPALVLGGLNGEPGLPSWDSLVSSVVFHHGDMF